MAVGGEITIKAGTVPGSPNTGQMTLWTDSGSALNTVAPDGSIFRIADASGWTPASETWTYYSADSPTFSFSAGADVSGIYSEGMRVKATLSGSETYMGIITGVSGSVVTTYGGTDYTLTDNTITSPYYSGIKAPYGFPLDPDKWTVLLNDTSSRSQSSASANTWYNLGSLSIESPIGIWNVIYQVALRTYIASSTDADAKITLSTANNSQSHSAHTAMTNLRQVGTGAIITITSVAKLFQLTITAKDTWYLNAVTSINTSDLAFRGDILATGVKLICAYL